MNQDLSNLWKRTGENGVADWESHNDEGGNCILILRREDSDWQLKMIQRNMPGGEDNRFVAHIKETQDGLVLRNSEMSHGSTPTSAEEAIAYFKQHLEFSEKMMRVKPSFVSSGKTAVSREVKFGFPAQYLPEPLIGKGVEPKPSVTESQVSLVHTGEVSPINGTKIPQFITGIYPVLSVSKGDTNPKRGRAFK